MKLYTDARLLVPLIMTALFLPGRAEAQNTAARDTYMKVKSKYQNMQSFSADIESEITITENSSYKMKGRIATRPPEKWAIFLTTRHNKDKQPKLMLLDMFNGETQWTYNTKSARLENASLPKNDKRRKAARRFFPAFELYRDDSLTVVSQTDDRLIIQLASDKPSSLFFFVRLNINRKSLLVENMQFMGSKKKVRISVSFTNINTNEKIDDSIFEPTDSEKTNANEIISRLESTRRQEN